MTLDAAWDPSRLYLATWGLDAASREEVVRGTVLTWNSWRSKHRQSHDIEYVHFGPAQAEQLAFWLGKNPNVAFLGMVKASSWSRAALLERPGPAALRTTSWPWGRPDLHAAQRRRCDADNKLVKEIFNVLNRILDWNADNFPNQRPLIFAHTEDLGPQGAVHPASIWRLRAMQTMTVKHSLMRSAAYQCSAGPSARPKPTAILQNFHLPSAQFWRGWPKFEPRAHGSWRYCGPLPDRCGCANGHADQMELAQGVLTAEFIHLLVKLLLDDLRSNVLSQKHLQDGEAVRDSAVLADDETDLDVEGELYFDNFPNQDDFEANGRLIQHTTEHLDIAGLQRAPGDIGLGKREYIINDTGSPGVKSSDGDAGLKFGGDTKGRKRPRSIDRLDDQLYYQAAGDEFAKQTVPRSAVSDSDFGNTLRSSETTPDTMRQCSSSAVLTSAGPPACAGGQVAQSGSAHASAVTRRTASEGLASRRALARCVERPVRFASTHPPATAFWQVRRSCGSRARPTGSLSSWHNRRTRQKGEVHLRVARRRLGSVPPPSCSEVSASAPPPLDDPRVVPSVGLCSQSVFNRPVASRLELSSESRLLRSWGWAGLRTPRVEEVPRIVPVGVGVGCKYAPASRCHQRQVPMGQQRKRLANTLSLRRGRGLVPPARHSRGRLASTLPSSRHGWQCPPTRIARLARVALSGPRSTRGATGKRGRRKTMSCAKRPKPEKCPEKKKRRTQIQIQMRHQQARGSQAEVLLCGWAEAPRSAS